jgi:hypothetical protein
LLYNQLRTNNYEQSQQKQTQSNPTCSELACGACPEPAEGSKVEPSNLFQRQNNAAAFDDEKAAARAYDAAAVKYHGRYANVDFQS